jgi:enoyl-CoA hydratase/carnithine racemase
MITNAGRVTCSIAAGVARVTLSRPEALNAFDLEMFLAVEKIQRHLARNRSVRAVIVTAEGSDFSSGLDVKSLMTHPRSMLRIGYKWLPWQANLAQRMCTNWLRVPCPVIVAIQGRCWGAGLQFALGGDFRIGSPDSTYGFMESRWGLIPDMGASIRLPGLVPKDRALLWMSLGEPIDANEAAQGNLITCVSEDPIEKAQQWVDTLNKRSPDALAAAKRLTSAAWSPNNVKLLNLELWYQFRLLLSQNRQIAVRTQRKKTKVSEFQNRQKW